MPVNEHPEWSAFLAAIVADPDDNTARLVAADWLEEHGQSARAMFIRVQVELAVLEERGEGRGLQADPLRKKEKAILGPLSEWPGLWAAQDCPQIVRMSLSKTTESPLAGMGVDGANRVHFRRGFIEAVNVPAGLWLAHGVAVRERNPIQNVMLSGCDALTRDHWYSMMAALFGLQTLALADVTSATVEWLRMSLPGMHVDAISLSDE